MIHVNNNNLHTKHFMRKYNKLYLFTNTSILRHKRVGTAKHFRSVFDGILHCRQFKKFYIKTNAHDAVDAYQRRVPIKEYT